MIQVNVDMRRCQHHGQCVLEAPSVFQLNDHNRLEWTATARDEDRDGVEAAVDICPMQAISIGWLAPCIPSSSSAAPSDDEVKIIVVKPASARGDGWPNRRDAAGHERRPLLEDGALNSPHGITVDPAGDVYLTEWLIGGRLVRVSLPR